MSGTVREKYSEVKQQLIDSFKEKMKKQCEDVLHTIYSDVCLWAADDDVQNYRNILQDELRDSFIKEISDEYGHYSWAHGIRMQLIKDCPDKIQAKVIEDLQDKIKSLEEHILELRRFR